MSADMITTSLGVISEADLRVKLLEQESSPGVWTVARECRYEGENPALAAHRGEIVRRDVWVTIKCGHSLTGEQGV